MSSLYFSWVPNWWVAVPFSKYSLPFPIPTPGIRYPSSLTKQLYFGELPDLHDSRYVYISISFKSGLHFWSPSPKHPYFALLYIAKQSSSTWTRFLLNKIRSQNELQVYILHAPTTKRNSATESDQNQLEIKLSPPVWQGCQVLSTWQIWSYYTTLLGDVDTDSFMTYWIFVSVPDSSLPFSKRKLQTSLRDRSKVNDNY